MTSEVVPTLRLDDLYRMVAHIYGDKNLSRGAMTTFGHFVEVCGMLTAHDRKKKREGIDVTDALCKALGWYFPLLAKLRVKSVEELIFKKFPYACPYCRLAPHQDAVCKQVKGTRPTVDHSALAQLYHQNEAKRPNGIDEWQRMFQAIYPRSLDDSIGRSTIGLLEELGELAEAIRVFETHPKYFFGEAADTFSYLMGIANEHSLKLASEDRSFSLEAEFLRRYPGLCTQCGSKICSCPTVPAATVGRMAKELDLSSEADLFVDDLGFFDAHGRQVAHSVFERVGGYAGIMAQLPFDRGDTNRALVTLCLQVAGAVQGHNSSFADTLRLEAYRVSAAAQQPGSPRKSIDISGLMENLENAWKQLSFELRTQIKSQGDLVGEIVDLLDAVRVLFVFCSPHDQDNIRVAAELREIRESLRRGTVGDRIHVDPLPAATPDDLRRALLDREYDIIHFAGHARSGFLLFEATDGTTLETPLSAIESVVKLHPSIKCVLLNACDSVKDLSTPISPCTIGMEESISDSVAVDFARGFYDALAAGKDVSRAYTEGVNAVVLRGNSAEHIKMINR